MIFGSERLAGSAPPAQLRIPPVATLRAIPMAEKTSHSLDALRASLDLIVYVSIYVVDLILKPNFFREWNANRRIGKDTNTNVPL